MRQSIGGAWIFGLVTVFILLFTAYLAVTINYSKVFKVKNDVVDIIEKEEGLTFRESAADPGTIQAIDRYLSSSSYNNYGNCNTDDGWYGGLTDGKGKYQYCVKKINSFDENEKQKAYYKVRLFFTLDLPVFGSFFTFGVTGETLNIYYPGDCSVWNEC